MGARSIGRAAVCLRPMADPVVTVVITSFNLGRYLTDAVESVEACGFPDYELIIVDDGSTDPASRAVAEAYKAKGYQVILQENMGVAHARNNAIKIARGRYYIPLDADNKLLPPYFFDGVKILDENPKIDVVHGDAVIIGEKTGTWENHPMKLEEMLFENYIDTCALVRKSMWEKAGGYDFKTPVNTRQDWIFWLDCIEQGAGFHYLKAFCFEYRFLDTSEVRKYFRQLKKRLLITEYIYRKQEKLIFRFSGEGKLEGKTGKDILSKLRMQLAYYHLGFGSVMTGYKYLLGSLIGNPGILKILKTGLGWPARRWLQSQA